MAHNYSVSLPKPRAGGKRLGLIMALGVILFLALSFFSIYWFVLGIVLLGVIMCVFLFKWHNQHKLEFNDLSALDELKKETPRKTGR